MRCDGRSAWGVHRGIASLCILIGFLAGCGQPPNWLDDGGRLARPRSRVGRYAAATLGGASYVDPNNLGPHGYKGRWGEKTGIVYTCRGGHIDIAHVRKSADWAAYLSLQVRRAIQKGQTEFSFKPPEPSRHYIVLEYPPGWNDLDARERDRITDEISMAVGRYLAFNGCVWHEMLTWFGYSSIRFYPDFPSAFSWEDTYSDLLGAHIGIAALRDTRHPYSEAVALALAEQLEALGLQPKRTAIRASEKARGLWYTGDFLFLVNMKKRNFDIGLDDGHITPWLVPGLAGCEGAEPKPLAVPDLDVLSEHGFAMRFEIEPKSLEKGQILAIAYPDEAQRSKRIEPAVHFGPIMAHIRADGVRRYGPDVDVP